MASVHVCFVPKENSEKQTEHGFHIKTTCNKEELKISFTILDGNSAFIGQLTSEYIEKQASLMRIASKSYFEDTILTLGTQGGRDHYSYSLQDGMFTWKKNPSNTSNIKIKVGSIPVQSVNYQNTAVDMIDNILRENNRLTAELNEALSSKQQLLSSTRCMEKSIKEICAMKDEMEKTLYKKFLQLLNEKKAKICQLQGVQAGENNNIKNNLMVRENSEMCDFDADTDADSNDGDNNIVVGEEELRNSYSSSLSTTKSEKVERASRNKTVESNVDIAKVTLLPLETNHVNSPNSCGQNNTMHERCNSIHGECSNSQVCETRQKDTETEKCSNQEASENDIFDQLMDWKSRRQTHLNYENSELKSKEKIDNCKKVKLN